MMLAPNLPALALGWAFDLSIFQPLENPTASQTAHFTAQTFAFAPKTRNFWHKTAFNRCTEGQNGSITLCYPSVISDFPSRSVISLSLTALCFSLLNRVLILLHQTFKVNHSIGIYDGC
jgi:hypothetical protein